MQRLQPLQRQRAEEMLQLRIEQQDGLEVRGGRVADHADSLVNTRRLPNGSLTSISRVPQGVSCTPGRAKP